MALIDSHYVTSILWAVTHVNLTMIYMEGEQHLIINIFILDVGKLRWESIIVVGSLLVTTDRITI